MRYQTLQEERRVQQRKENDQTHHTNNNNNKVPFQTTTKDKNNTCETCAMTNLDMSYSFNNTPQRKAPWPQRGREHTYCHPYLSPPPYSILTRPDRTQLLYKTLQEERRVQQRKEKDQTHHTNNNNKVPFQTTSNKERTKRVRLVPR